MRGNARPVGGGCAYCRDGRRLVGPASLLLYPGVVLSLRCHDPSTLSLVSIISGKLPGFEPEHRTGVTAPCVPVPLSFISNAASLLLRRHYYLASKYLIMSLLKEIFISLLLLSVKHRLYQNPHIFSLQSSPLYLKASSKACLWSRRHSLRRSCEMSLIIAVPATHHSPVASSDSGRLDKDLKL